MDPLLVTLFVVVLAIVGVGAFLAGVRSGSPAQLAEPVTLYTIDA